MAWPVLSLVGLSFAVLILVAVMCGRGGDGAPLVADPTDTPGGTATVATPTATPPTEDPNGTTPASPETLTPDQSPTEVTPRPTLGPVLPCGDILVPISKQKGLPSDCEPPDLTLLPDEMSYVIDLPIKMREQAAAAMVRMLEAARDEGLVMVVRSAYRSYWDQDRTYAYNVATYGQEYADRSSARPGHSEHQMGTTGDLTSASNGYELEGFGSTAEGQWIAENATRFGFVISYPPGAEAITGYIYEPWHVRYVGEDVAAAVADSGLTPVEYLEGLWTGD